MKIGIRREDKNEWERRVPLTPVHVEQLTKSGFKVSIQASNVRIFSDVEYANAGAAIREDLTDCDLVLAVKEIPVKFFRKGGVFMFFPHVCKGQSHNMSMLRRIMEVGATLIDFERVVDDSNRRLIFFGNHAGSAGMIETFHALGRRLEWEGFKTQFAEVKRPVSLDGIDQGCEMVRAVGQKIKKDGLPDSLVPLVVGFAGYGNVSKGAQAVFDLMPHEQIAPRELEPFFKSQNYSSRKLYKVVFEEEHFVRSRDIRKEFSLHEYYEEPERYLGVFEEYLPYLTVLMNCIYWDQRYPKLVTKDWIQKAWASIERPRLKVLGDISCDIEGAIECTLAATDPGDPMYTYVAAEDRIVHGWKGEGPVVMAVDTLPSEVPREASSSFGDMLAPFLHRIVAADFGAPFGPLDLPNEIKKAVIVHRGDLTPNYRHLLRFLT